MSEEYKALVLAAYQEKQALAELSLNLNRPTPANLRAECVIACSTRYLKKDEVALRSFFGPQHSKDAYLAVIKKYDIDKFRPLRKFMDGAIVFTDDKNVALLAWLIDFEPRPYQYGQLYEPKPRASVPGTGADAQPAAGNQPPDSYPRDKAGFPSGNHIPDQADQPAQQTVEALITVTQDVPVSAPPRKPLIKKRGVRYTSVTLLLLALAGGITFLLQENTDASPFTNGKEQCMYWSGETYRPIPCNQKSGDAPVIALDTLRLARFKRITRPDTLTESSVRKVYYFKYNNQVLFYTAPGFDPVHTDRRLKPLTLRILNEYARHP